LVSYVLDSAQGFSEVTSRSLSLRDGSERVGVKLRIGYLLSRAKRFSNLSTGGLVEHDGHQHVGLGNRTLDFLGAAQGCVPVLGRLNRLASTQLSQGDATVRARSDLVVPYFSNAMPDGFPILGRCSKLPSGVLPLLLFV